MAGGTLPRSHEGRWCGAVRIEMVGWGGINVEEEALCVEELRGLCILSMYLPAAREYRWCAGGVH